MVSPGPSTQSGTVLAAVSSCLSDQQQQFPESLGRKEVSVCLDMGNDLMGTVASGQGSATGCFAGVKVGLVSQAF